MAILDQHGNSIQQESTSSIWMSYEEVQLQKQLELRAIANMFPTLRGFLWDYKSDHDEQGKTL